MINGTGSLSLRKQDLENQKIPAVGFVKTAFAHKASAGATGISLSSLTLPPEMSANGFVNPSAAQLAGAQLLFYKNNLTLVSSARGILQQGNSYTVASSTQINFLGFTALEGEIFTGTIDYTAQTGLKVVDARPINATGTLAASTTDFNVGTPFKTAQYITTQIGGVLVFLDGIIQYRNTSNSSTVLDGNYYEVDAGGGLGTIIRFNVADPVNTRNVLVVSNGLLSERPDGSMMATIESVQGQVNNMATYVAAATGNTTTTILGGSPTNVDLKAFGDRVLSLEQTRARIDQSNVWTAAQPLVGITDGSNASAGLLGEIKSSTGQAASAATSGTGWANIATITLTPGDWDVSALFYLINQSTTFTANANSQCGISTQSATNTGFIDAYNVVVFQAASVTNNIAAANGAIPKWIINVTSSQQLWLVGNTTYTSSAPLWKGSLIARRVR